MNCKDITVTDLKGLSKTEIIRVLAKERNDAHKSRYEWIQCAYSMYNGSNKDFYKLTKELCEKCRNKYHANSTK